MNPLSQIPLNRLLIYLGAIALLPILLALISHQSLLTTHEAASAELSSLHQQILLHQAREAGNKAIRAKHSNSDHHYIDNHLETLPLLQDEVTSLQALLQADDAGVDETLIKRLMFLKEQNRLNFAESQVVQYGFFQETTETLAQPVEVNESDVMEVLNRIEHPDPKTRPPQLLITKFRLDRKDLPNQQDHDQTFHLTLQMIKREF